MNSGGGRGPLSLCLGYGVGGGGAVARFRHCCF
jgi:hypothetical protein